jgi:serine/threonine protein kinase
MTLSAGTHLGPYEILAPLGAGGMGEVYRARDGKLNRDVAVKVLPEGFVSEPERLARFQREAEVLASLNHLNIAHIYGIEDGGETRGSFSSSARVRRWPSGSRKDASRWTRPSTSRSRSPRPWRPPTPWGSSTGT